MIALSIAAMILAFSIARATNRAPLSLALVQSVLVEGSRYPLDMFWHIARITPLTLVLRSRCWPSCVSGLGGDWRRRTRAHALWIGWVLWFGVIESGITTNYLLLPMAFMLIAIAVDLTLHAAIHALRSSRTLACYRAVVAPTVALRADGQRTRSRASDDSRRRHRRDSRQPSAHRSRGLHRRARLPDARRPHRSLAGAGRLRARAVPGPARRWTGRPASTPACRRYFVPPICSTPNADGTLPDRVVIVDIFKEYPIGNSRTWLPKAIEEDGLQVSPCSKPRSCGCCRFRPRNSVASLSTTFTLAAGRQSRRCSSKTFATRFAAWPAARGSPPSPSSRCRSASAPPPRSSASCRPCCCGRSSIQAPIGW